MVEEIVIDDSTLSESAREPFIGRVVWSKYPCDCEICSTSPVGGGQWHIQIEPLDGTYTNIQHEWYRPSKTKHSAFGKMVEALVKIGYKGKKPEDLEDKVFEWNYAEYETPGGQKKNVWIPVREVSEEEVEMLEGAAQNNSL